MPTKEAPRFIPEEEREIIPENGFPTETNRSVEELPIPNASQGEIPKEKSLLPEGQSETEIFRAPRTPKPDAQIEIQPHQEEGLTPEKPKKERLEWFRRKFRGKKEEYRKRGELLIRKLEKEGVLLTEEDKRKLFSIPMLWTINAVVSTCIGNLIVGGSIWSLIRHRDLSRLPSLLSYNLIPGGIRLGATVAFEQLRNIKFDGWSKLATILCGWGMPVEIAIMSKKSTKHQLFFKILFDEFIEHYIRSPWARARNLYRKAHKMIRKE